MSVVVITGCSSGIGLEAALAFARNGDTVYATMRDVSRGTKLQSTADAEGLDIQIAALDLTRADDFPEIIGGISDASGHIDVLVNNAGINLVGALEDLDEDELRAIFETNLIGPLLLTRAVLPGMRAQRSGYIIMMSSLSGIAGLPGDVAYTASKFGLEGATEALRHEVDRWGIHVALVQAGMYSTGMFGYERSPDSALPASYPPDSPYQQLIDARMTDIRSRIADASHPRNVGELFVRIANSDGNQLRWPADEISEQVLDAVFAHSDQERDEYLRKIADSEWWSCGQ